MKEIINKRRRQAKRYKIMKEVALYIGSNEYNAYLRDISIGGISFELDNVELSESPVNKTAKFNCIDEEENVISGTLKIIRYEIYKGKPIVAGLLSQIEPSNYIGELEIKEALKEFNIKYSIKAHLRSN